MHFDSCTSKEECVVAVFFPNGFDFLPGPDAAKTASSATAGKKQK